MLLDSKAIWGLFGGVKSWRGSDTVQERVPSSKRITEVGVTVYDQGTVQSLERILKAINFAAGVFVLRY